MDHKMQHSTVIKVTQALKSDLESSLGSPTSQSIALGKLSF